MSITENAVEDLLGEQDWTGKIYSGGWVDAPETVETIDPATGEVLGTAGIANAASVAAATKSEPLAPFGGFRSSSNGGHFGGSDSSSSGRSGSG